MEPGIGAKGAISLSLEPPLPEARPSPAKHTASVRRESSERRGANDTGRDQILRGRSPAEMPIAATILYNPPMAAPGGNRLTGKRLKSW